MSISGMVGGGLWRLPKGLKHPIPGRSISRASPGKAEARRAEKGEQHWVPTSSREGLGGQVPGSCFARGHRHEDIHTHPHNFLHRAANSSGSCLTADARPSPRSRGGGDSLPSRAGDQGTVPYLPAWHRGYVSMALSQRERGRQRGARTGLAGAGSAGGAKPPGPPPPLHWSRALPICRHHPGTLPACEPPPGTGRVPNPLPTVCPEFAVSSPGSPPRSGQRLGWASRHGALMCGALRSAGVPPRLRNPLRVHNPLRCSRGQRFLHSPTVPAPIPAS